MSIFFFSLCLLSFLVSIGSFTLKSSGFTCKNFINPSSRTRSYSSHPALHRKLPFQEPIFREKSRVKNENSLLFLPPTPSRYAPRLTRAQIKKQQEEKREARRERRRQERLTKIYSPLPPYVERVIPKESRIALEEIKEGEWRQGQIISMKNYGLHVDIGTSIDGFLHISALSATHYFPKSHLQEGVAFKTGSFIKVWVKKVVPERGILQLQLYPVKTQEQEECEQALKAKMHLTHGKDLTSSPDFSISQLKIGHRVGGIVQKISKWGVFVKILHRLDEDGQVLPPDPHDPAQRSFRAKPMTLRRLFSPDSDETEEQEEEEEEMATEDVEDSPIKNLLPLDFNSVAWPKLPYSLRVDQLYPLGSYVDGFIFQHKLSKTFSFTTVAPEDWDLHFGLGTHIKPMRKQVPLSEAAGDLDEEAAFSDENYGEDDFSLEDLAIEKMEKTTSPETQPGVVRLGEVVDLESPDDLGDDELGDGQTKSMSEEEFNKLLVSQGLSPLPVIEPGREDEFIEEIDISDDQTFDLDAFLKQNDVDNGDSDSLLDKEAHSALDVDQDAASLSLEEVEGIFNRFAKDNLESSETLYDIRNISPSHASEGANQSLRAKSHPALKLLHSFPAYTFFREISGGRRTFSMEEIWNFRLWQDLPVVQTEAELQSTENNTLKISRDEVRALLLQAGVINRTVTRHQFDTFLELLTHWIDQRLL